MTAAPAPPATLAEDPSRFLPILVAAAPAARERLARRLGGEALRAWDLLWGPPTAVRVAPRQAGRARESAAPASSSLSADASPDTAGEIPIPLSPQLHLDRRAAALAVQVAAAPADTLLSRAALAAWLGCAPKTLARWDRAGVGPRRVRAGLRAVRYLKRDVLAWLEGRASTRGAPR